MTGSSEDQYIFSKEAADFIISKCSHRPKVGIVCGSGLGGIGETLTDITVIEYSEIPHFPVSTVQGHAGRLLIGTLGNKTVMCMQGRFHPYEGHAMWKVALPIRVMKLIGVENLIVTNASGGINSEFNSGDIMIIRDHINFAGYGGSMNPLLGPNCDAFGTRFPSMNKAYNKGFGDRIIEIADQLGFNSFVRQGIYVFCSGPAFESIAEIKMLKLFGGDCVGMSTIPEVIVAVHCGIKVLGLSVISNIAIIDYGSEEVPNADEVLAMVKIRSLDLQKLIINFVESL